MRSGVINSYTQTGPTTWSLIPMTNVGVSGGYWSSMSYSSTYDAYNLVFYGNGVEPSRPYYNGGGRRYAFPLRCLAS